MPSTHRRLASAVAVTAALASLVAAPRRARAAFSVNNIYVAELEDDGRERKRLTTAELANYFSLGRCDCDSPMRLILEITPDRAQIGTVKVLVGTGDCIDDNSKNVDARCVELFTGRIQDQNQQIRIDVTSSQLMGVSGACGDVGEKTLTVTVMTDANDNQFTAQAKNLTVNADTTPPGQPAAPTDGSGVVAGEALVKVNFTAPDTTENDVRYQILCQRVDDPSADPLPNSSNTPIFKAASDICPTRSTTATDGGSRVVDQGGGSPSDAGVSDFGDFPDFGDFFDDGGLLSDDTGSGSGDGGTAAPSNLLSAVYTCSESLSSAGSVSIKGLENGKEYKFWVVSVDQRGNASVPVELGTATPALEEDFWERYKRSGGGAGGGCGLAGPAAKNGSDGGGASGGFIALLTLLGAALGLRRRRRRAAAGQRDRGSRASGKGRSGRRLLGVLILVTATAAAAAIVATPRAAHAQADPAIIDDSEYHSSQWFAFEFKLGPYTPNIDAEFGGTGPYEAIFGGGGVMLRAEFDVQIFKAFGTLGIGFVGGYFSRSANAFADDSTGGGPSSGAERSGGETSILLVPISVLAVYRFDVLAKRWSIPIVPFVKFGLNYTLWWIFNGSGDVASVGDDKGRGGSFGLAFNAGVAFLLDVLEPGAAKTLDNEIGINHSYIFFEMAYTGADGFGSADKLDVGDLTWQAGLAFEF